MSSDPIDVVDVGTDVARVEPDGVGVDVLPGSPPAPSVLSRWAWWRTAGQGSRTLAVVTAAAVAVAVTAVVDASVTDPPVRIRYQAAAVGRPVTAVDATGCPADRRCRVVPAVPTAVDTARRTLPGSHILSAVDTVDRDGHVYARRIVWRRAPVTVRLIAQCTPGSSVSGQRASAALTREIDTRTLPDGEAKLVRDRLVTHRLTTVVGPDDCSVSVVYTDRDTAQANHLALTPTALSEIAADAEVALS